MSTTSTGGRERAVRAEPTAAPPRSTSPRERTTPTHPPAPQGKKCGGASGLDRALRSSPRPTSTAQIPPTSQGVHQGGGPTAPPWPWRRAPTRSPAPASRTPADWRRDAAPARGGGGQERKVGGGSSSADTIAGGCARNPGHTLGTGSMDRPGCFVSHGFPTFQKILLTGRVRQRIEANRCVSSCASVHRRSEPTWGLSHQPVQGGLELC